MRSLDFRADINGLRAIAVLAVMAFHFGVAGLGGGFVGVDVFFVISGYLMTSIIMGRLERGTFSVLGFYLDRGRRIIPPLAVLVATLLVAGLIWFIPIDLLSLGKNAASAITFLSNIFFRVQSGYFARDSGTNWLLHTWSLSTEWQFYIIYPLLILLLRRGGSRVLLPALVLVGGLSFGLLLWLAASSPASAFYLLPPRAWEMIAGGLVMLLPEMPDRFTRVLQLGGLAAISASILLVDQKHWPGVATLGPVIGAMLVIAARRTGSRITGNPVASWIGLNSYSIYLWHWPLAVLMTMNNLIGDWRAIIAAFVASMVLGHLSWRFVEQFGRSQPRLPRVRTGPDRENWRQYATLIGICTVLAIAGVGIWLARGLPQRFSPEVRALEADVYLGGPYKACLSAPVGAPPCLVGPKPARPVATLIGDSHADAVAGAIVAALPPGGGLVFSASASCPPVLGAISTDADPHDLESHCGAFLQHDLVPLIRPRSMPVILVAFWNGRLENQDIVFGDRSRSFSVDEFRNHLLETGCALAKAGPTYIMLPTPEFPFEVATTLQYRLIANPQAPDITMPLADHVRHTAVINAMLHDVARQCGVHLLDPIPYICPNGQCMGSIHHRAVFHDKHHLTEFGNKLLTPMFRTVFTGR